MCRIEECMEEVNRHILGLVEEQTHLLHEMLLREDRNKIRDLIQEKFIGKIMEVHNGSLPAELIKEIFINMYNLELKYLDEKEERKLLVSSNNNVKFLDINEMFGLGYVNPTIIGGPCAIESTESLEKVAVMLQSLNIKFIRAGAFKPRTSPYDFQGLGEEGLKILREVSDKYSLYAVTEVMDTRAVDIVDKYTDVFQIGARNMQNFELLKEVGRYNKPVILKRGMSSTINELIYASEYIALQGSRKIIICERGIRTFENKTRNTLDISSIPIIKIETKLPVIVDLSHSLGRKDIILQIAKAALAVGADGIMVEVHPNPQTALSDSNQQLNLLEFKNLINGLNLLIK
ncbi:MAG TPA: bifunctional 3-deoxy-7-phosphoheptulonate synthase/chorismate mutase [Pseudobacteroides sp.]|nr:bifunctional 3-deoxy-7-phosphoheptulonate synthase/chorismate mutase [Pseudobacteroides sp.]